MPYIDANGSCLYYEDTGGSGPAVIFSHGLLMDGDMFAPQVEVLRSTCRCITWDQRGFGRTGPASEPFTYWTSARDVLDIMSSLNIEAASLVGLSQGGFLSMRAALLAPERVSALVLLATRSGVDAPETIENFKGLRAEWANNGSKNVQDGLADILLGPGVEAGPWTAKWASIGTNDMNYPLDALIRRDDITPRLEQLKCPALVIHGNADIAIDIEQGRQLARDLPGSGDIREIDGAGHAVNLAQPAQVTKEISAFLGSLV
jgi:3-oxoadipate enol-lactonase